MATASLQFHTRRSICACKVCAAALACMVAEANCTVKAGGKNGTW